MSQDPKDFQDIKDNIMIVKGRFKAVSQNPVSYTHLRAHETPEHLVCRLLLEKKKTTQHTICY